MMVRMHRVILRPISFVAWLALAVLAACSSDPDSGSGDDVAADVEPTDTAASDAGGGDTSDAGATDADARDAALEDTGGEDTGGEDAPPADVADTTTEDVADAGGDDIVEDTGETDTANDATEDPVDDTGDDAADVIDDTPYVRIGTGWDDFDPFGGFEPLDERGTVRIAEGIQGGFHVWGGFEGRGMDESDVESSWQMTNADGDLVGGGFFVSDMRPYEGRLAAAGLTVFIALEVDVETLDDVPHELCVDVTMADGTTASDCATVRPSCCDYL